MTIKLLWSDILAHRTSAGLFMLWWLSVFAFTFVTWSGGMPDLAVSLHVVTAILAGGLVAWWRFPLREGLLIRGWPAPPALAGALVAIAVVSAVFIREGIIAAKAGEGDVARAAELFTGWLVAGAILGAIGLLCGLAGGIMSGVLAKHFKRSVRRAL